MAGQTGAEQARADMRELVQMARGRGAGRLVLWGGVAVTAFTAAFASWQLAPIRSTVMDPVLATGSLQPTLVGTPAAPQARQVGGQRITTVPGVSDITLLQRDLADLRQELIDLRRGLTRYDVTNEQVARRLEAVEDQASILASRFALKFDTKPIPPGTPVPTIPAGPPQASALPPAAAPSTATKPSAQRLEPVLFDTRAGKVAARPLVPDTAPTSDAQTDVRSGDVKQGDVKPVDIKQADVRPVGRDTRGTTRDTADSEGDLAQSAVAREAPKAQPKDGAGKDSATKAPAKEPIKEVATPEPAKPADEPVIATAPVPVPPPAAAKPPASTPPIAATVRPPPTPAEEAQRAQRALQAAQVQQLAQQMIMQQPGAKGAMVPLPAQTQLAAAAAAAKEDARGDTTGGITPATDAKGPFAVDLGGYKSLTALRKGWTATSAKYGGLTKSLTPLGQMKESGGAVEARLVAGPFANATDAAKFCAQVQASGTACAPSVYVGQPLAP